MKKEKIKLIVCNRSAYASVSVANVDSDDYPEIVVPSLYGIVVLDYNQANGKLEKKCNNTDGRLWGSAVISDVDNCDFGGVGYGV